MLKKILENIVGKILENIIEEILQRIFLLNDFYWIPGG